jgi:esterase/lipase superfamily enzyme
VRPPATVGAPAPSGGSAPPAAAAPPPELQSDWDVVPVFYGTDRARRDTARRIAYGADRARRMELGRALVTVPKNHQVPAIERPWSIRVPYTNIVIYEESEDPKRHFTVQAIKAYSKAELLEMIRARLAGSRTYQGSALVFIHGYNNGFDDALYRTAQLAYDLKFDGAPFLYSWPSGAGTLSYPYDRDSAQQAEQYLMQFLQMVLNETGAQNVNIIAHSMGNQPLLQVLRELRRTSPEAARINQIVLAAPDVDRDTFEYLSAQIQGVSRGITMYASSNDRALVVSRQFAGGIPRAGDVPEDLGPTVITGIDTIDISALSTDYLALNHSSYAEKTQLLSDIETLLRTGQRPPELRLNTYQRIRVERGEFWRFKP